MYDDSGKISKEAYFEESNERKADFETGKSKIERKFVGVQESDEELGAGRKAIHGRA